MWRARNTLASSNTERKWSHRSSTNMEMSHQDSHILCWTDRGGENLQLTSSDPICAPSVWLVFSLVCNWTESHSIPQHLILMPASNTWKPDNSVGPGSAVSSACQNQRTSKKFAWPRNLATASSQHLFAILDQVNRESRQLAHLNPPTLRKKKKKKKVLLLVSTLTVGQESKWLENAFDFQKK